MATIPVYTPRNGLATGSAPRINVDTTGANAVAGFGRSVQVLGQSLIDEQARNDAKAAAEADRFQQTQDASWFSKTRAETAVRWQQKQVELQQAAGADNPDYTATLASEWAKYNAEIMASAPTQNAATIWQQWAPEFEGKLLGNGQTFAQAGILAKRENDLNAALNAHSLRVAADPDAFDEVLADAMDDLAGASMWLTPEQEVETRANVEKQLKLIRAGTLAKLDPVRFKAEAGFAESGDVSTSTVNKIIQVESGGNASAKNPRSSASGLGQFTDSTWLSTIAKHRPDLAALSRSEQIALKTDPQIARAMTIAHTKDNEAVLAAAGLPVTEGTLYLAHFAGSGGARRVLSAPDDATVLDVLGAAAVRANPFLQGKTVGWLKSWADRKMGSTKATPSFADNPMFAGLTPDEVFGLNDQADQVLAGLERSRQASITASLSAAKGAFDLAIATGEPVQRNDILSSALPDDDKAVLINKLNARDKETVDVTKFLGDLQAGQVFNPLDADTQKLTDKAYEAGVKAQPGIAQQMAEDLASKAGVVPKGYLNDVRAGLMSSNPAEVLGALQQAQRLRDASTTALSRDGGKVVEDAAVDFKYMTEALGFTAEEAAKKFIAMNDPEKRKPVNEAEIEKAAKALTINDVTDAFDDSVFAFAPEAGFAPEQQAAMLGDFRELFRREFIDAQDPTIARGRAIEKFKRLYAPTSVTGTKTLMKYPPESYYPPAGSEGHSYLQGQALDAARQAAGNPELEADNMFLLSTPQTAADVRAGRPPSYLLGVVTEDANGFPIYDILQPGMQFAFDPVAGIASAKAKREADLAERAAIAREQEMMKRGEVSTGDPVRDQLNRMRTEMTQPTDDEAVPNPSAEPPVYGDDMQSLGFGVQP